MNPHPQSSKCLNSVFSLSQQHPLMKYTVKHAHITQVIRVHVEKQICFLVLRSLTKLNRKG